MKIFNDKSLSQGRTMLEMIAVLVVMVILTYMGLAIYREVSVEQKVDSLHEDLMMRGQLKREGAPKQKKKFVADLGNKTRLMSKDIAENEYADGYYYSYSISNLDKDMIDGLLKKDYKDAERVLINGKAYNVINGRVQGHNFPVGDSNEIEVVWPKNVGDAYFPSLCDEDNKCPGALICGNDGYCINPPECDECTQDEVCFLGECVPGECKQGWCCPSACSKCNLEVCTSCHAGYYLLRGVCTECPEGATSEPAAASCTCPNGETHDIENNVCYCPENHWRNGEVCTPCAEGAISEPAAASCTCPGGKTHDLENNVCYCPENHWINGGVCMECPEGATSERDATTCTCPNDYLYDTEKKECYCPDDYWLDGEICTPCPADATCGGGSFTCNAGYVKDTENKQCITCSDISEGAIYDSTYNKCVCPEGNNATDKETLHPGYYGASFDLTVANYNLNKTWCTQCEYGWSGEHCYECVYSNHCSEDNCTPSTETKICDHRDNTCQLCRTINPNEPWHGPTTWEDPGNVGCNSCYVCHANTQEGCSNGQYCRFDGGRCIPCPSGQCYNGSSCLSLNDYDDLNVNDAGECTKKILSQTFTFPSKQETISSFSESYSIDRESGLKAAPPKTIKSTATGSLRLYYSHTASFNIGADDCMYRTFLSNNLSACATCYNSQKGSSPKHTCWYQTSVTIPAGTYEDIWVEGADLYIGYISIGGTMTISD